MVEPGITKIELRAGSTSVDVRFAVEGEAALVGVGIADVYGNIGYVVLPGATRQFSIANNIPLLAFDAEGRSLVPPSAGQYWRLERPIMPGATYEVDVVLSADGETFTPAMAPGTAWGRATTGINHPGFTRVATRPIVYRNPEVAVSSITAERPPTPLEQIDAQGRGQLIWERVPSRVPQGAWQTRFVPEGAAPDEPAELVDEIRVPPPPPPPPPTTAPTGFDIGRQLYPPSVTPEQLASRAQQGLRLGQDLRPEHLQAAPPPADVHVATPWLDQVPTPAPPPTAPPPYDGGGPDEEHPDDPPFKRWLHRNFRLRGDPDEIRY